MDQMRLLPQATDRKVKLLMQLFQVLAHQVAHLHVLAVIPAAFVPGVEIWSVSRQSLQPDLAACAGHELCYRRSAVDRRAVPDHQQPLARHTQQVLQELDALHRVERLLPRQREDLPRRRQPAQNGQVVARLLLAEDGCLSLGTISPDQPRQQVEPRFVLENQHAALTLGAPEQFRPDPATPAADGFLVPLDGSPNRHWGRPVQVLEQLADVAFVVAAAQLLLDHQGDARTGPHLASKPVGLRAMPEKLWNQTLLSGRELGRTPRTGLRAQSLRSAVTGTGEPTADAHGGDAERFGDVVPRPALLFQVQRSEPPPLKAGSRKEIMVLHTPILGGEESNLLCAAVSKLANEEFGPGRSQSLRTRRGSFVGPALGSHCSADSAVAAVVSVSSSYRGHQRCGPRFRRHTHAKAKRLVLRLLPGGAVRPHRRDSSTQVSPGGSRPGSLPAARRALPSATGTCLLLLQQSWENCVLLALRQRREEVSMPRWRWAPHPDPAADVVPGRHSDHPSRHPQTTAPAHRLPRQSAAVLNLSPS